MSGPPQITPEKRAAIADAIRQPDGPPSFAELCAHFECSRDTIVKVAESIGMRDAWEHRRAQTEAATASRAAILAERRTQLQTDLLDDIQKLREKLFGEVTHLNVVKVDMGTEEVHHTVLPAGPADWRATMGAITGAVQQTVNLARLEAENSGTGAASSLLEDFEASLRQARHDREAAAQAPDAE
jgi:hypothetical protein